MNIWASENDLVKYSGKNGSDFDQLCAIECLLVGEILTVKNVNVQGFSSDVEFKEYPGKTFNTVMFEDVEIDLEKAQINSDNFYAGYYGHNKTSL